MFSWVRIYYKLLGGGDGAGTNKIIARVCGVHIPYLPQLKPLSWGWGWDAAPSFTSSAFFM